MAEVSGIDDLLPTAALAVALAAVEETQRLDGLQDEVEENAPRVKLTRFSRTKQNISILCVVVRRCWKMKTSLTP